MVKGNNMSPYAVNGSGSVSTQVCWDGTHQELLPAGYETTCGPNGSVASIALVNPGSGYYSTVTAALSAPPVGGVQALADVVLGHMTNGQVVSITAGSGGAAIQVRPR